MKFFIPVLISIVFFSCNQKKEEYKPVKGIQDQHEVVVNEVVPSSGYLYLNVQENDQKYWMAVSKSDIKVGDKLYYKQSMEMVNFKSKDLDRVFEKILFVDYISKEPIKARPRTKEPHTHGTAKAGPSEKTKKLLDSIKIGTVEGTVSIENIYKNVDQYVNKDVAVRGQIVKINSDIMNRNWVHLMDGTHGNDRYDLTFTTQETLEVGDTVILKGTLAKDKEFGAGYVYPVIIESAVLK